MAVRREALLPDTSLKLHVILGSTRPTRHVDLVAPWVTRRAEEHGAFRVEVIDLREWALPHFAEHVGSIGDFADPTYSDPLVKAWNAKIRQADAHLFVTPEYNHSIPGELKNAIDSVFVSFGFRNKPVAAVGYSVGIAAGTRAVEHLALVMIETEAAPLRNSVLIPKVADAFDEAGNPTDRATEIALQIVLEDLGWWGRALREARRQGELLPGSFRMMAAMSVETD
jgi:NAD(P)H-dependent FMN reductase